MDEQAEELETTGPGEEPAEMVEETKKEVEVEHRPDVRIRRRKKKMVFSDKRQQL